MQPISSRSSTKKSSNVFPSFPQQLRLARRARVGWRARGATLYYSVPMHGIRSQSPSLADHVGKEDLVLRIRNFFFPTRLARCPPLFGQCIYYSSSVCSKSLSCSDHVRALHAESLFRLPVMNAVVQAAVEEGAEEGGSEAFS